MLLGIQFKDEYDKNDLVEKAQTAKESVCELWEKLAERMPELHEIQERRYYHRGNALVGGQGYMAGPEGWHGNVGYRDYSMGGYGMNHGGYRNGGYNMGGYGHYRENPAWTGPNDRRGY